MGTAAAARRSRVTVSVGAVAFVPLMSPVCHAPHGPGKRGSLVFDDTRPWAEKLTLYRDDIAPDGANFAITRAAPMHLPVPESEPLKLEMRAFITCCETGEAPPTGIADGLAVQRVLQAIDDNFTEFGTAPDHLDITPDVTPDVSVARKG